MVGLALKDQGIDVVAVGNGEAAVRKIADVRPDLVLADVFMPVRNGYEVCQFVKMDSALSHIPVILLVGAFDPLDEQEAQRVGADGVLKKPFIPPDPLISMVKAALQASGAGHTSAPPRASAPEAASGAEALGGALVCPAPEACSAAFTMEINGSGGINGFFNTPSAPTLCASCSSRGSNAPTSRITGICDSAESIFTNWQTS